MQPAIERFCEWLSQTRVSIAIQSAAWVIPTTQTLHILAIATLASSALFLSLRVLASPRCGPSSRESDARFLPTVWWSLAVLFWSGVVLIIAEPARALLNPAFYLKMSLLLTALLLHLIYQWPLGRNADYWRKTARRWFLTRALAVVSLLLWTGVILSGRWIAYIQTS